MSYLPALQISVVYGEAVLRGTDFGVITYSSAPVGGLLKLSAPLSPLWHRWTLLLVSRACRELSAQVGHRDSPRHGGTHGGTLPLRLSGSPAHARPRPRAHACPSALSRSAFLLPAVREETLLTEPWVWRGWGGAADAPHLSRLHSPGHQPSCPQGRAWSGKVTEMWFCGLSGKRLRRLRAETRPCCDVRWEQ